jgi:hypothetical protein
MVLQRQTLAKSCVGILRPSNEGDAAEVKHAHVGRGVDDTFNSVECVVVV